MGREGFWFRPKNGGEEWRGGDFFLNFCGLWDGNCYFSEV